MPVIQSKFLGEISCDPGSELYLPAGLPGFEDLRWLLPVEIPAHRPLVFLQSSRNPDVCLVCLPASSIEPGYRAEITEDDRALLELDSDRELIMGEDILCLALLLPAGDTVRTNLEAPIVINLRNYKCAQVISEGAPGFSRRLSADGRWETSC